MSDGNSPRVVSTFAELKASDGQVVRVKGKVQHEKLGDTVMVDGLDVLCPDLRLPDGVSEATLEGRLELWSNAYDVFVARYSATGTLAWVRQGGGVGSLDDTYGVAVSPDGSTTIVGQFQRTALFDTANPYAISLTATGIDGFVARFAP